MVFVKFYNMNRKKKFLMSPLNTNSKIFTLQVKTMLQSQFKNVQFSFLFYQSMYWCTVYFTKNVCSFFLFFFFPYAVFNNVQVSSLSFFFSVFFLLSCTFLFLFSFSSFFFFLFFHNKLLIQCPFFFQPYIYLSVFTLTR